MVYILMNPLANNHKGEEAVEKAKTLFDIQSVKVVDVRHLTDVLSFVRKLSTEDKIVIAGGDGTLARFVNSVYDMELQQEIYLYPCGSGNDFYRDVKDIFPPDTKLIPLNDFIKDLPEVVVNGSHRYFLNGIGFGIDGYCCEQGDIKREESEDKINYTNIAIKGMLFDYKRCNAEVTVDGETKKYKNVILAPTMFGRYYGGGMMVAPNQNRKNPKKTVTCVVWKGERLPTLMNFSKIFTGEHIKLKDVEVREGHSVKVVFDKPTALQIDGETVRDVYSYSVVYHNHDKAIL